MTPQKTKIIFIGTSDFAVPILKKLIVENYSILAVITSPAKPVGRRKELKPSPVEEIALKHKLFVIQPEKIVNCQLKIENLRPDLIVVASYGQIIPKKIIKIPKHGTLNIHPSLLPKYRGASPIQTTILNGDKETWVTIILMDEKMDHGPVLTINKLPLTNNKITTPELEQKLAELGAKLLIKTIPKWVERKIKPQPQDHSKATFTKILTRQDGHIDWSKTADQIERQVRAYTPWPGSFSVYKSKRLKIFEATAIITKNSKKAGQTFLAGDNKLAAACGQEVAASDPPGALILEKIQLEGGKVLTNEEFLRGHPKIIGEILN